MSVGLRIGIRGCGGCGGYGGCGGCPLSVDMGVTILVALLAIDITSFRLGIGASSASSSMGTG